MKITLTEKGQELRTELLRNTIQPHTLNTYFQKKDSISNMLDNMDDLHIYQIPAIVEQVIYRVSPHPTEIKVTRPKIEISEMFSEKYTKPLTSPGALRTREGTASNMNFSKRFLDMIIQSRVSTATPTAQTKESQMFQKSMKISKAALMYNKQIENRCNTEQRIRNTLMLRNIMQIKDQLEFMEGSKKFLSEQKKKVEKIFHERGCTQRYKDRIIGKHQEYLEKWIKRKRLTLLTSPARCYQQKLKFDGTSAVKSTRFSQK